MSLASSKEQVVLCEPLGAIARSGNEITDRDEDFLVAAMPSGVSAVSALEPCAVGPCCLTASGGLRACCGGAAILMHSNYSRC
jgi:hypothetical protein